MSGKKKDKSLGKRAKHGAAWAFLREGGGELIMLPSSMVMARLLSPEEFGIAAAAGFFTLLASQLSGLGLNAAIIRIRDLRADHLSSVFVVNIAVGALMFGALVASAPWIARFYGVPETAHVLRVAALGFLVSPISTVPSAVLTRDLRFRETALADWFNVSTFTGVSLLLAWLGFSYMSMVYGRIAGVCVSTTARVLYSPWKPSLRFSVAAMREILPFGIGVHAKRLLDYSARNLDSLVVGKFYGMTTLGIYDKAFSTVERLLTRMNSGGPGVLFRIFSIIHDDSTRFVAAYRKVVMSTTMVAFPVLAVFIVTAPQLIAVLFGEAWHQTVLPFQILCVSGAFKLLNVYASSAIQAAGRVWGEVWRQALYVAIIVGGLALFRTWGAPGAALGVLLATLVMTTLMHLLLKSATSIRWRDLGAAQAPALTCAVVVAMVVAAVGYLVRRAFGPVPDFALLSCQAAAAILVYVAFVLRAPSRPLRSLVLEVYEDLAPARVKRWRWVQRLMRTEWHAVASG